MPTRPSIGRRFLPSRHGDDHHVLPARITLAIIISSLDTIALVTGEIANTTKTTAATEHLFLNYSVTGFASLHALGTFGGVGRHGKLDPLEVRGGRKDG